MTNHRSTADVEAILRRTYAEVAERTVVMPAPTDAATRPAPHSPPGRTATRRLLAFAAVLALVVGGLIVLANRDAERPAGRGVPTRVVPGWVPRTTSADGDGRPFALTEIDSDAQRDRVTYASAAGSVTVELDRTTTSIPDGSPVVVRGVEGRRTDSSLAWIGPADALVQVTWSGQVSDAMVDSFVQGLAEVDDETWEEVAGTGGFREPTEQPLAQVRVAADEPFEVGLVGDLHVGLSLRAGPNGFSLGSIDACRAGINYLTSDLDDDVTGYVVLAPGHIESAVVRPIGNDDRVIEMTSLLPLADVSIGGVVYEERAPNTQLPRVECQDRP